MGVGTGLTGMQEVAQNPPHTAQQPQAQPPALGGPAMRGQASPRSASPLFRGAAGVPSPTMGAWSALEQPPVPTALLRPPLATKHHPLLLFEQPKT